MVRFVLNSSKIYVEKTTVIHPYKIDWTLERDGSLRINDPYYLKTDAELLLTDSDIFNNDSSIYKNLFLKSGTNSENRATLRDLERPYLLWKNADSDTIYILKNNIPLFFLMKNE